MSRFLLYVFVLSCTMPVTDPVSEPDASLVEPILVHPIEEKSLCETSCLSNKDCEELSGICLVVSDFKKIRTICTRPCNNNDPCTDEGFACIPLLTSLDHFEFQCIPVEAPVCEGY